MMIHSDMHKPLSDKQQENYNNNEVWDLLSNKANVPFDGALRIDEMKFMDLKIYSWSEVVFVDQDST